MELLSSSLLPVPHGFSTREGGVSEGPFASLNLGFSVGDSPDAVQENLRRLARAGEVAPSRLRSISQVHGAVVLEASDSTASEEISPPVGDADALWTAARDTAVGVKTADCVPILLADPEGKRVAAVHSGWRGTDLRISARTVETLISMGARAPKLLAAVGPCIRECCYEVSDELAQRFAGAFGADVTVRRGDRWHLNLVSAVVQTLRAAGLPSAQIDTSTALCTSCEVARFFSHRRDAGKTGRHFSFAVCRF